MNTYSNSSSPVDRLVDQVNEGMKSIGVNDQPNENDVLMPFKTSYVLSKEQEEHLVDHALKRLSALSNELGRNVTSQDGWWFKGTSDGTVKNSFMGRRELFELMFHNHVDWRPFTIGGIFADSNLVVPLSRRIVRQMVARANNYFFSTDPWFSAYPVGMSDELLADRIDRYTKWKLAQVKTKRAFEKGIELAFIRGESVIKTTHVSKEDIYEREAMVLVDMDNRDILDANGNFITQDDAWVDEVKDDGTGQIAPTGVQVLKRDGVTKAPATPIYVSKMIKRKKKLFSGPESSVVFYKDFLCPLTAPSVEDADCVIHLYDMPVADLADAYQRDNLLDLSDEESIARTQKLTNILNDMSGDSADPKSAKNQPRREIGEEQTAGSESMAVGQVGEFYLKYDANGDGIQENIMVVIDIKNKRPIFYDYLSNVTPDGKRPFSVFVAQAVDGRWYGQGAMEMFESSQSFVDLLINRVNFSQSGSGRVTFWDPSATVEGDSDPHLKMNMGETYTLKPGKKAEDALEFKTLPEVNGDQLFKLLEFFMQLVQLESGVVHAGDQNFSGMDSAKLATGIRNIEKSGQEMFAVYLSALEPGVEDALSKALKVMLANLDKKETFYYFEGETMLNDAIAPEEVDRISLDVELLLTRYRGEQVLQSSAQASVLVREFYSLPPVIQARTASLYIQMLKALQVTKAEEIIQPMPEVQAQAPGQAVNPQQLAASAQSKPTGKSENLL